MVTCTAPLDAEKIKSDLKRLRLRQTDLIEPLHNKGLYAPASSISTALNGKGYAPRFQKILAAIAEIIEEEDRKYENR